MHLKILNPLTRELINEIEFRERSYLRYDPDVQKLLQNAKSKLFDAVCCCKNGENVLLTLSYLPNTLKKMEFETDAKTLIVKRNHHYEHDESCPFYKLTDEYYDNEIDRYKSMILISPSDSSNTHGYRCNEKLGKTIKATFRRFAEGLMSDALVFVFNSKNKESATLQNPTFLEYCDGFGYIMGKTIFKNGEKAIQEAKKYGVTISFGLILEDINTESATINLHEYSRNSFKEKKVNISEKRRQITARYTNIHGHIITGPYFYLATYLQTNSNDEMSEIIRLHIYPIVLHGEYFSFIESNLERQYATTLIESNTPFLKPVSGNELKSMSNRWFPCGKPYFKGYRPDFIEFHDDGIHVIEVCGYAENQEYMRILTRKEEIYNNLSNEGKIAQYVRA
jgi:hypothetical protein